MKRKVNEKQQEKKRGKKNGEKMEEEEEFMLVLLQIKEGEGIGVIMVLKGAVLVGVLKL